PYKNDPKAPSSWAEIHKITKLSNLGDPSLIAKSKYESILCSIEFNDLISELVNKEVKNSPHPNVKEKCPNCSKELYFLETATAYYQNKLHNTTSYCQCSVCN